MSIDEGFSPIVPDLSRSDAAPDPTLEPAKPKGKPGAPRGNRNAQRHGVKALQKRLQGAGLVQIDGRSDLARLRTDWMEDVRAARGGDLSPQHEALLLVAANTWLMLSTADDYILRKGPLENKRRGLMRPIVEQRGKLARTLRELLSVIGMTKAPRKKRNLDDVLGEIGRAGAQDELEATD